MLVLFATTLLFMQEQSFAERVEFETGYFCERRFDESIACWPGRVRRADGVFGVMYVDVAEQCLQIIFPDGIVCGLPEGSVICEYSLSGRLDCSPPPYVEPDWPAIWSRFH